MTKSFFKLQSFSAKKIDKEKGRGESTINHKIITDSKRLSGLQSRAKTIGKEKEQGKINFKVSVLSIMIFV
jgi:hypothetical protein